MNNLEKCDIAKPALFRNQSRHSLLIFLQLCLVVFTACTARDLDLENALTAKLQQFKNSNAPSMDLNDVLGKNWIKVCVQSSYEIKENFNKNSGENISRLLDISENEIAVWVFYNDNSVRAAILKRNILDFRVSTSRSGTPNICTSTKYPHIYTQEDKETREIFYFNDR